MAWFKRKLHKGEDLMGLTDAPDGINEDEISNLIKEGEQLKQHSKGQLRSQTNTILKSPAFNVLFRDYRQALMNEMVSCDPEEMSSYRAKIKGLENFRTFLINTAHEEE